MDVLKEYKMKQANERLKEIQKVLDYLDAGNLLEALFVIYNNEQDKGAMAPIIRNYFENQLMDVKKQLKAYRGL